MLVKNVKEVPVCARARACVLWGWVVESEELVGSQKKLTKS